MNCSVIICAHNPRQHFLKRVLDALKTQTRPRSDWELLLIDNASSEPLADRWSLSWHPQARHIHEHELGLTRARLRGIHEARGDWLVFVDDDNVLGSDYLESAIEVASCFEQIGAFGGSISGEYEVEPPVGIHPYLEGLAIRELVRDSWSNLQNYSSALPVGAGLCVRRDIAKDYADKVKGSVLRQRLDRIGAGFGSGGDTDMVLCAIDAKLGVGRFSVLKLTHLIPKERLTENYIKLLYSGFAGSKEVLDVIRPNYTIQNASLSHRTLRFIYDYLCAKGFHRQILLAERKGRNAARRFIAERLK